MTTSWNPTWIRKGWIVIFASLLMVQTIGCKPASRNAPEADTILAAQASMPFQILIPAYLPRNFDRANVDVNVDEVGEGGEPMVTLTYRTTHNEVLFIREWLPVNPENEVLSQSRPIDTKWGRGWLLAQGKDLTTLWVDVGPLRVSLFTRFLQTIKNEQILEMADTMGPASDQQVFSFVVNAPSIHQAAPPPPLEIKPNANGVQELTLVVTPGGYSPLRFSVKKGVPVKLTFKQLGDVGCGNELIFPADPASPTNLKLKSKDDQQTIEFTPRESGDFQFMCSHQMYRGVMTVHD